jgi:hypothetical protein
LTNLADGPHYVEVTGKRDSGLYQDDPLFGEDAVLTRSTTWTVQSAPAELQIASISPRQDGAVSVTFLAEAGKSYSLLERDALDAAHPWVNIQSTPVETATSNITITDTTPGGSVIRFYEVVTPALP